MNVKVEVFSSPGCSKCGHAKELLRTMALELGEDRIQWRDVNILEELDYAVEMGVLSTPAIAVNGKLVFAGLPAAEKLKALLVDRLNAGKSS